MIHNDQVISSNWSRLKDSYDNIVLAVLLSHQTFVHFPLSRLSGAQ